MVLEPTPESPLGCKEIKPVHLKGNQPSIFVARTDAEAEAPVFWLPGTKSQLTGKVPGVENDWGQEKRVLEDEMAGWHHWLNGHELGQTLGDGEGPGGLMCCSSWGLKSQRWLGHWTKQANSLVFWKHWHWTKAQVWQHSLHELHAMTHDCMNVPGLPCCLSVKESTCKCRRPWVWSLGREDPLEKEMATHSSIPTGEIPWTEELCGLQSMGLQRVRHDLRTKQLQQRLQWFHMRLTCLSQNSEFRELQKHGVASCDQLWP